MTSLGLTLPPILAVTLPILSTLIGGLWVLKTNSHLRLWLSLSGGVLLGLAFLDLLPEIFERTPAGSATEAVIGATILGSILFFHVMDKLFDYHGHEGHEHLCVNKQHESFKAWSRVSGMGLHSLLDGLAIGGGFAAGNRIGFLVTLALMLHKFTDGMTTVTIMHKHSHEDLQKKHSLWALFLIILLPIVGYFLGNFVEPSPLAVTLFLAALTGLFIHLPLSELLPEAHSNGASRSALFFTVLGILLMAAIRKLAAI